MALVCYLDDSGEKREPYVTLAGYLGIADAWARFEPLADALFAEKGIEYLHTVDLHHRRKQFDGWSRSDTLEFAKAFFDLVGDAAPVGVEFSVSKEQFNLRKAELGMTREGSPLTFCFKGMLQNMMRHEGLKTALGWDGVDLSFVVEDGKRSEPIVKEFNRLKAMNAHGGVLRSMTLEDKKAFKALQAADFFAYFSRRLRCLGPEHKLFEVEQDFFHTATAGVQVHSRFLANDFG